MNDRNVLCGQVYISVVRLDTRIIPLCDLSQEDAGQRFRREAQFLSDARHIVGSDIRAEDCGEVKNRIPSLGLIILELLIVHRAAAGVMYPASRSRWISASARSRGGP